MIRIVIVALACISLMSYMILNRVEIPPFDLLQMEDDAHTYIWFHEDGDKELKLELDPKTNNYWGNPSVKEWNEFSQNISYENFNYQNYIAYMVKKRE